MKYKKISDKAVRNNYMLKNSFGAYPDCKCAELEAKNKECAEQCAKYAKENIEVTKKNARLVEALERWEDLLGKVINKEPLSASDLHDINYAVCLSEDNILADYIRQSLPSAEGKVEGQ